MPTPTYRPTVVLFSDVDALGFSLLDNLLINFCRVVIYNRDKNLWLKKLTHLFGNRYVDVVDNFDDLKQRKIDYLLLDNSGANRTREEIEIVKKLTGDNFVKTLLILPYIVTDLAIKEKVKHTYEVISKDVSDLAVVYVGDLFGPRMSMIGPSRFKNLLQQFLRNETRIFVDQTKPFYPTFTNDLAKEISRSFFSFGFFGEAVFMLPEGLEPTAVVGTIGYMTKTDPVLVNQKESLYLTTDNQLRNVGLKSNTNKGLKETLLWFQNNPSENEVLAVKKKPRSIVFALPKLRLNLNKGFLKIFLVLLTTLMLPIILSLVSISLLFLGGLEFKEGHLKTANYLIKASYPMSKASEAAFVLVAKVPVIGWPFDYLNFLPSTLVEGTKIVINANETLSLTRDLVLKIMSKDSYPLNKMTEDLAANLDLLYQDVGFLQSDIAGLPQRKRQLVNKYLTDTLMDKVKEKLYLTKLIVKELPELIGFNEKTTYLVLLQNNMELRSTGGFIGSFALVTFEKGRLTGTDVYDVYSADGQLKGHVEPPPALKNSLNQANWYLRDANWDPDFPSSAQKVEWFLDKEIDKEVNGVIGIDLEVIRKLLRITGGLNLADFTTTIDENNVYVKVQSEVEEEFFPGSRKKANFLTALTKEMLNQLPKIVTEKDSQTFQILAKLLQEKHIQIFLHNSKAQKAIGLLGYDGGVNTPYCLGNCYYDWAGLVDANVGVNKANYFINRKIALFSEINEKQIKRTMTVVINNTSNANQGYTAKYKSYLRLLVPVEAVVAEAIVSGGGQEKRLPLEVEVTKGRKEAGLIVEVEPKTSQQITFNWESPHNLDFSQNGEYGFYLRKQAGTIADPVIVAVIPLKGRQYFSQDFSLTKSGDFIYNGSLVEDLSPRLFW